MIVGHPTSATKNFLIRLSVKLIFDTREHNGHGGGRKNFYFVFSVFSPGNSSSNPERENICLSTLPVNHSGERGVVGWLDGNAIGAVKTARDEIASGTGFA